MNVGDIVDGKYRVIRLMGEGGMGAVYEVHHDFVGGRFALKCLHPQLTTNAEIVKRFVQEARAASAIGSEHIIQITDGGQLESGAPFLVMEYLEGEDLAFMLKREGRLDQARAVGLVLQVCEALQPAHERGIVHRDLKPANLFLTQREKFGEWVKVLDFGIAKVRAGVAGRSASMTKTGATLGTPHYMAPEQFMKAKHVDHRADVYAAGVILYEMLAGCWPFDADSYEEFIVEVATGTPRPLAEVRPDVDEGLAGVVMRSLARDTDRRFQSVEELSGAIEAYAGITAVTSVPPTILAPATTPPQKRAIPATQSQNASPLPPTRVSPVKEKGHRAPHAIEDEDRMVTNGLSSNDVPSKDLQPVVGQGVWESNPPDSAGDVQAQGREKTVWTESRWWLFTIAFAALFFVVAFVAVLLAVSLRNENAENGPTTSAVRVEENRPGEELVIASATGTKEMAHPDASSNGIDVNEQSINADSAGPVSPQDSAKVVIRPSAASARNSVKKTNRPSKSARKKASPPPIEVDQTENGKRRRGGIYPDRTEERQSSPGKLIVGRILQRSGSGTLDASTTRGVIMNDYHGLVRCFEYRGFGIKNRRVNGSVTVYCKIGTDGSIRSVETTSRGVFERIKGCVAARFRRMDFPPPDAGDASFMLSLVYEP